MKQPCRAASMSSRCSSFMAAPAFFGFFQQFLHQSAAADFIPVCQHLVLDTQHRPDVGNGNAGNLYHLLRGDGEKLHRGITSLGEYAEQPLFKSFFHHQRSFLFWYVKGAAPAWPPLAGYFFRLLIFRKIKPKEKAGNHF